MTPDLVRYGTDHRRRYGTAITPDPVLHERNRRAPINAAGLFTMIEDTAYFVFVGRTLVPSTPKYVEFQLTTAGTGAQTAEVGLFSTTSPPSKASLSLTKLTATGTVDNIAAGTGMRRNTSAFTTIIGSGVYLWAGFRTAMATNEPVVRGVELDYGQGYILTTLTAGALTAAGPWTGALTAGGTATVGPTLRVVYD